MIQARFGLSLFAELFSCLKIEPKLNCWNCRNLFVIILYLYNFHNLIITLVTAKNDRFHVGQSKTKYNFLYLYLFVIRCVSKLDEICLARCSFDLNFKQKTNQVLCRDENIQHAKYLLFVDMDLTWTVPWRGESQSEAVSSLQHSTPLILKECIKMTKNHLKTKNTTKA